MARKTKYNEIRIKDVVAFVDRIKSVPCMDCGGSFPTEAMDFDHARGVKVAGISYMVRMGFDLDEIGREMDKCDIVCSNCHRVRTRRRANQKKHSI